MIWGAFLGAAAIEVSCGIAYFGVMRFEPSDRAGMRGRLIRAARGATLVALWCGIALGPCLISLDQPLGRWLNVLITIAILTKLDDTRARIRAGERVSLAEFVRSLPNLFWIVRSKPPAEAGFSKGKNARLLIARLPGAAIGIALCVLVFRASSPRWPFLVEHACKVIAFYIALSFGANAAAAGWRLGGGIGFDPFGPVLRSRTVGEFWRRWNRPAAQFLHHHGFIPAGGLRHPIRATLFVFFLSAVLHEYIFTMAIGRVQGFQMAFFLLNGIAAIATLRWRPRGGWAIAAMALTFSFELLAGVLFFASMNHIVHFYDQPLPGWIGQWDRRSFAA